MHMDMKNEQIAPGLEGFVQEFLTDREVQINAMDSLVRNQKFEEIAATTHQWKSFCAPYGFGELGRISIELEKAALEKSDKKCFQLIEEAKKYLDWKKEQ